MFKRLSRKLTGWRNLREQNLKKKKRREWTKDKRQQGLLIAIHYTQTHTCTHTVSCLSHLLMLAGAFVGIVRLPFKCNDAKTHLPIAHKRGVFSH